MTFEFFQSEVEGAILEKLFSIEDKGAGKGIRTGITRKEVKDWVLIIAVVLVADITEHREVVQFW